ncbi:MAG: hypothetical protein Q7J54_05390 [Candidatus Woesearchaeota archaeon]|nr:hypothetical protein [Candidatus Woesearchaeota archaeon]
MADKEITKMVSKYIAGRRRSETAKKIAKLFKKIKIPRKMEAYPELKEAKKSGVEVKMMVNEPKEEQEEFSETAEEMGKEEKPGFFSRLFGRKKKEPAEEVKVEETIAKEEASKDIKELSRMFLSMLDKLSEKDFGKFKDSESYVKFKEIVKKYK